MEHIFDDSSLSARAIGVLLWCQHRERFTALEIQLRFPEFDSDRESLLDLLTFFVATKGYFELVGDYEYVFVGARKKEKVLTAIEAKFDAFRQEYRKITGNPVPGIETALKLLKKHRDWREIVDRLLTALQRESDYKAHLKSANKFCPPWPNFATWMNQRRFENEFDIPVTKQSDWKNTDLLIAYKSEVSPYDSLLNGQMLSEYEYSIWHSKIGPFLNIDKQFSPSIRRQKFIQAHEAARLTPQIVEKAGGLFQYLVAICKP